MAAPEAPPGSRPAPSRHRPLDPLRSMDLPGPGTSAQEVEEQEDWVISYMDMVTLLMTVFLGMVAILGMQPRGPATQGDQSNGGVQGHAAVARQGGGQGLLGGEGLAPAGTGLLPEADGGTGREGEDEGGASPSSPDLPGPRDGGPALSPQAAQLLAKLEAAGLPPSVDLSVSKQQVTITLQDRILFASGSATLEPSALATLQTLATTLAAVPGTITVAGHTDDVAISTARFPSNWELSSARAAAVVRTLIAQGLPPGRLQAVGYADTRPVDADPQNRARNRRVEILVDTAS